MMKTLVVSYIPRGERSHTKKLLDAFLKNAKGTSIEHIELTKDVPDLFLADSVMAYIRRDYMGEKLTPKEAKLMANMDRMTEQFIRADNVVIAFPMYNFSMPAAVKAYFDSIMLKGKTWDMNEKGFVGLVKGKKALVLISSGGAYEGQMKSWDHASSLTELELKFMGFEDIMTVTAGGMNMYPEDKIAEIEAGCQKQVKEVALKWFGK